MLPMNIIAIFIWKNTNFLLHKVFGILMQKKSVPNTNNFFGILGGMANDCYASWNFHLVQRKGNTRLPNQWLVPFVLTSGQVLVSE